MNVWIYRLLADGLVVLHVAFVVFAAFGALLVAWRPWLVWLQLPAVAWAALVELNAWVCPLTPWEQALRAAAGEAGYQGGFVQHYLLPVLYPSGLTAHLQTLLGFGLIAINALSYAWVLHRRRARRSAPA